MIAGCDFYSGDIFVIKDHKAVRPWGKTEKIPGFLFPVHLECEYYGMLTEDIKKGEEVGNKYLTMEDVRA